MAKSNKLKEMLDKIPEEKQKKLSTKDKIAIGVEAIKQEYGIDVEPTKNIKFKIEKIVNFINERYDFRYNVINTDTEYKPKDSNRWTYFDDRDYRDIKLELKMNNIPISDEDFKTIIFSREISKEFNPFMDYFNSAGKCDSEFIYDGKDGNKKFKGVKSGRDHIFDFCSQVQLVDEENNREYFVEGFRKWFTAMVVGLIKDEPNMYNINQTCLVLVGGQGKYKTTFLKSIIPQHLQLKYFYGSSFQVHNKDHEKFLAYMMLINFDEMAALNKTDIESLKSAISRDQIIVRLPYAKADVHLKRRASFAATQNNKAFLRDETGSRRWLVIEIENIQLNENFDLSKMYAQGLQHYKDGLKYWFDNEDIKKIEAVNEKFQARTFEYEIVDRLYTVPTEDEIRERHSLVKYLDATEIASKFSKDNNVNNNNSVIINVGKALSALGFKKRAVRRNGKPVQLWCVKEALNSNIELFDEKGNIEDNNVI